MPWTWTIHKIFVTQCHFVSQCCFRMVWMRAQTLRTGVGAIFWSEFTALWLMGPHPTYPSVIISVLAVACPSAYGLSQ